MVGFRLYWKRLGAHVHVRVFAGYNIGGLPASGGKCGDLTFREDEWAAFRQRLLGEIGPNGSVVDVRPEDN